MQVICEQSEWEKLLILFLCKLIKRVKFYIQQFLDNLIDARRTAHKHTLPSGGKKLPERTMLTYLDAISKYFIISIFKNLLY